MSMQISQDNISNEYDKLLKYLETQKPKADIAKEKEVNAHLISKIKQNKALDLSIEEFPKVKKIDSKSGMGFDIEKFESLMRSKLIDEYKKLQSYDRPYISVTELTSCIRKSYYQRQKYPIDIKSQYKFAYLSLINHVGESIHSFIQELYDFEEVEKTIISEKYKVKGRIDGIRGKYLVEIKSIDEDKFNNSVLPSHYQQGLIYANILNNEYNYSISFITVVYVLRTLKKLFSYDMPYNQSMSQNLLNNSIILKQAIDSKKIPEPINSGKDQCKYCSYIKFCAKDGSTKIELPFNKKTDDIYEKYNLNNSMFIL